MYGWVGGRGGQKRDREDFNVVGAHLVCIGVMAQPHSSRKQRQQQQQTATNSKTQTHHVVPPERPVLRVRLGIRKEKGDTPLGLVTAAGQLCQLSHARGETEVGHQVDNSPSTFNLEPVALEVGQAPPLGLRGGGLLLRGPPEDTAAPDGDERLLPIPPRGGHVGRGRADHGFEADEGLGGVAPVDQVAHHLLVGPVVGRRHALVLHLAPQDLLRRVQPAGRAQGAQVEVVHVGGPHARRNPGQHAVLQEVGALFGRDGLEEFHHAYRR